MKKRAYLLILVVPIFLTSVIASAREPDVFARLRVQMVKEQIMARGIKDPRVIAAMMKVPRHLFVPKARQADAYGDYPLPIGAGQTISQPYIVAYMTEVLNLKPEDRVLEIGTGSGYQAAILAELAGEVYTIEIIKTLGKRAEKTLKTFGYKNILVKIGDGYKGWPRKAPFDAVIVTCAPERIPEPLVLQLKEGGRMIIPVGGRGRVQKLVRIVKTGGRLETHAVMYVRFVPMVKGRQ